MRVLSRSIDLQRLGHDRQQPLHFGFIAVFIQADAEPFRHPSQRHRADSAG